MKNLLFILLTLFTGIAFGQVKLPDIGKVDSVRVVKRLVEGDSVRKIQMVTIEASGDTIRGALQDSAALAAAVRTRIAEENTQAANNTFLLYQQFTKVKGVAEYNKMYRRITGQNYTDYTWATMRAPYLGKWQFSGQGVTSHMLTVSDDAKAIRDTGTPKYSGTMRILAQTRIELVNYLTGVPLITFDFVARNEGVQNGQRYTQEIFMSTDGRYFMVK